MFSRYKAPARLRAALEQIEAFQLVLTSRGFVTLIALLLLLAGPVWKDADIVAAVVCLSLLTLALSILAITTWKGLQLRRDLGVNLSLPDRNASLVPNHGDLVSGTAVRIFIRLSRLVLPPFFVLELRLYFRHGRVATSFHRITTSLKHGGTTFEDIIFPHRGNWSLARISAGLSDQFGLTKFNWKLDERLSDHSLNIKPPHLSFDSLPVVSSCQRDGDSLSDIVEPQGDPFDLKPYHPSDGMRKILWKLYAKSGTLISRHAERSMTPEGQVIIFALAGPEDDRVCGACIAYARKLKELGLELIFNCEGNADSERFAHTPEAVEELLVESVWETLAPEPTAVKHQLMALIERSTAIFRSGRISKIIIFASPARLSNPILSQALIDGFKALDERQIKPVLFSVLDHSSSEQRAAHTDSSVRHALGTMALRSLVYESSLPKRVVSDPAFMRSCAQHGWEVISC
ncbi:MAG: DUF58 domain-containing protein [Oligoflexia bacterium]|nr:DUF58 domain-containing protein [Oligoflexia bacterium]